MFHMRQSPATGPVVEMVRKSAIIEGGMSKRLIVACDGTWLDSDSGFERDSIFPWNMNGHLQVPSNVTRFCRALKSKTANGIPQIVYYQAGIGSENNWYDHLIGGGTGMGISENIRAAYAFVAENYQEGDEVFIVGFSRGAFTARSVAGLISAIGLLTRRGMSYFYEVFTDWENQVQPSYKSQWPDKPFPNRPNITDPRYSEQMQALGLTRPKIIIKSVAVWDTVGSLGIPDIGILPRPVTEYSFVNTVVDPNIEYAFQALALDENRRPFSPTIWEKPDGQKLPHILKQCWFPGVHSNIGGGYDDQEIADITLAWMMSQMYKLLEFDSDYIMWANSENVRYYANEKQPKREWGMGEIYNVFVSYMRLAGSKVRTPGQYCATDGRTGAPTKRKLKNTNEHIHVSVRTRVQNKGPGTQDKGVYTPSSLKSFKMVDAGTQGWQWQLTGMGKGKNNEDSVVILPEDTLGDVELKLLKTYPVSWGRVFGSSR